MFIYTSRTSYIKKATTLPSLNIQSTRDVSVTKSNLQLGDATCFECTSICSMTTTKTECSEQANLTWNKDKKKNEGVPLKTTGRDESGTGREGVELREERDYRMK